MELEHLRQSEELKDVDAFKIRYEKFHQGKIDLIKVAHEEEMRTLVQRVSTLTESARAHEAPMSTPASPRILNLPNRAMTTGDDTLTLTGLWRAETSARGLAAGFVAWAWRVALTPLRAERGVGDEHERDDERDQPCHARAAPLAQRRQRDAPRPRDKPGGEAARRRLRAPHAGERQGIARHFRQVRARAG